MKNSSSRQGANPMFELLAELPLLRGASPQRLSEVCGQMKIRFSKAGVEDEICRAGNVCNGLVFILSGSVRLEQTLDHFGIEQTLEAPQVIAPENLFGLSTTFPCTVKALTSVSYMEISKEDYRRMLTMDSVFLFNYLNMLSARAQRSRLGLFSIAEAGNAQDRVTRWIEAMVRQGAKDIVIRGIRREPNQLFGISISSMRSVAEKLGAELSADTLRLSALT